MYNIDFDILFEYLSYIESGSLQQFNTYLSNMSYEQDLENYEKANIRRMFSRLAHIEFDYNENKFSVCPPTICIIPNTNKAILTGRRTKDILKIISDFYDIEATDNYDAPKCLIINIPDISVFKINLPQIRVSLDFTKNILRLLPSLKDIENNLMQIDNYPISDSFLVRIYDNNKHKFTDYGSKMFYKDGLYEIIYPNNRKYYINNNTQWYKIEKKYGKFLFEKNQKLFKHSSNQLWLKQYMRLPELIDRGLTMRSGKNPKISNGYFIYDNIDNVTAKKVLTLLDQDMVL